MSVTPAIPAEVDSASLSASPEASLPQVGTTWRGLYQIRQAYGEASGPRVWRAFKTDTIEEVMLRAVLVRADDGRPQAWRTLETIQHPHLVQALTSFTVGAYRVEVTAMPAGQSLAEWRDRGAGDLALVERVLRPVAEALAALHEKGLGHFALRPEHVFVGDDHGALHVTLGGLEAVASVEQRELVPLKVDPYYAPPEAAGLYLHAPGRTLGAWDWWSLGRTLQYLVLGQHVLGHLLQRDVSKGTPELQARAESLLFERDTGATRAGAVEAMPAMDKRLDLLLRGLLTSARDARWNYEQVAAWLRREKVKEHYRLPRNERMFRWRDHAYTVSEVADLLRSAEHWAEGLTHVWEADKPGTLAHFLGDSPTHRQLREKHNELLKLAMATALRALPPETVRDTIAAVALLELVGADLVWRGHSFDTEGLGQIFGGEGGDVDRLALLQAFTARPVILQIERCDPDAARTLTEFAQVTAAAEALVRQHQWLREDDVGGMHRLLRQALKPVTELRAELKTLHDRYACSTDPVLDKFFRQPAAGRSELIALAWAGENAEVRGFLTHTQWAERELARLRQAGEEIVAALFWLRLGRALGLGPLSFGPWRVLVPIWVVLAIAGAIVWPGPGWLVFALMPGVVLATARLGCARAIGAGVRGAFPGAAAWTLQDGAARCRREAKAFAGARLLGLERAHRAVNAEIAGLTALQPPPAQIGDAPYFRPLIAVSVAGWLVVAGFLASGTWKVKRSPPSWRTFTQAWTPPSVDGLFVSADGVVLKPGSPEALEAARLAAAKARALAKAEAEALGPTKVTWPFKPAEFVDVQAVTDYVQADPEQLRHVRELGMSLSEPYKPETITTLVIIRVPTAQQTGMMIYDPKTRKLDSNRVYLVDWAPIPRSWIEVAGRRGIYIAD